MKNDEIVQFLLGEITNINFTTSTEEPHFLIFDVSRRNQRGSLEKMKVKIRALNFKFDFELISHTMESG